MAASNSLQEDLYSQNGQSQKSPSPQPQHRRGYQACDPCRKRKVKCDLGSVDNPRPPPCVRCRRESKRCEFSATRRKRKPSEVEEGVDGVLIRDKRMMVGDSAPNGTSVDGSYSTRPEPTSLDSDSLHSRQKWSEGPPPAPSQAPQPDAGQRYGPNQPTSTTAPAAPFQDARPVRPPMWPLGDRPGLGFGLEGSQPMMNRTAVELLSPAISNSHDALHLLSEAAGRTEDLNRQSLENRYAARQSVSSFNSPISPMTQAGTPRSAGGSFSRAPRPGNMSMGNFYNSGGATSSEAANTDVRDQNGSADNFQDSAYVDAVRAWSRLRFVRAGWLTVEESMAYVAYYYEHLAPLSPIVIPDFSHPSTHRTLLTDEPVLAVTILTTASRHMKPKGDGAYTRAFYIHDRLWSYLRGMIERLFWGQEKFGGNGIGISKPRSFDLAPSAAKVSMKGNLRSLGSIEALLILTDWHPRNLHFPPGDDENTLLDLDGHAQIRLEKEFEHDGEPPQNRSHHNTAEGRLAFQKWLEPAWRSDRMSWMLLSTAQALAFELGVFDQKSDAKTTHESPAEQTRKRRLRRLILVYITQSSGRLGIPSMLPLPQWTSDIQPTPISNSKGNDATIDRMHDCWIGITKIMYQSNQLLFASNEQTSELIRSGRYRDQIDRFQPFLREWRSNIDTIDLAPAMRHILMIEYEYTRVYVNSLALQAVVDRWTTMSNEAAQAQNGRPGSGPSSNNGWFHVLMELYRVNEQYIQEVVDASRRILQTVLEDLVPGDHMKHAPVRTCFRILSGMIFILKTFTLGAKEDDVRVSLDLQDRTVEALRTSVVDDVHLSHAIARLLELLTSSIRTRFLRFAPLDRGGDGDGHDRTSAPVSRHQSPRPRDSTQGRRDGPNHAWTPAHNATQNIGYVDSNNHTNTTMASGHDPLAAIPAQPINSSNINVSFMPPPPSVYHNYYDSHTSPPPGSMEGSTVPSQSMNDNPGTSGGLPDWFALPLDQFFNSSMAVVDHGLGGTGPMVGEFDMLEVLLNEQYDGTGDGLDSTVREGLPSQFLHS
ncbi:Zn(II)2Cys6 transcription factor domain-containing protein [Aspergillus clavatus NRRL 1]|uniref:C6 transcription factor, putative n=1 Tax=Aspergillus clavatus (strain ATCC 1007 / CBS 513.65 / DSM 816 / NCTC 3887 / NRRL 1 / QM 1276 / 107) TaxID=344612 RepID=A1CBR5_ASPCL|nr:C6 transcription factor, putative [Aspergillus clavatus NRRL 1]EAW13183.1 C6 transcription factor, putative [Aspergillus clavatus NRRL 1]